MQTESMTFSKDGPTPEYKTGLQLVVMGEFSARSYYPESPYEACISITSIGTPSAVPLNARFVDVLRLQFDDTSIERANDSLATSITDSQADAIVKFVMTHKNRDKLVIHCFAGMSRSRSVAAAIAHALNLPFSFTVLNNDVYTKVTNAFSRHRS